ncbi:MAG TPA: hypothetical protein VKJ45_05855 [Blastocatellia bacterium]|nr:hypothetical protein [Blastocatellia bacterium]
MNDQSQSSSMRMQHRIAEAEPSLEATCLEPTDAVSAIVGPKLPPYVGD